MQALAPGFGVTVSSMERNEGVYKGGSERSYAIGVEDGEKGILGYSALLGKAYGQEAVGAFSEDPNGKGRDYMLKGITDPEHAAKIAADRLGFANVTSDTLHYWGSPKDAQKVADLAAELGATVEMTTGHADFIEAKDYDRYIRDGQSAG